MALRQVINGNWQDALGNALAFGLLTARLNTDGGSSGVQIAAGRLLKIPLDGFGSVAGTVYLQTNDGMSPAGTSYDLRVYTAQGQAVWRAPRFVLSAASTPYSFTPGGGVGGTLAVTSVTIFNNVLFLGYTGGSALTIGSSVLFSGIGIATFLDGETVVVSGLGTGGFFTAPFVHSNYPGYSLNGNPSFASTVIGPFITPAPLGALIDAAGDVFTIVFPTVVTGPGLVFYFSSTNFPTFTQVGPSIPVAIVPSSTQLIGVAPPTATSLWVTGGYNSTGATSVYEQLSPADTGLGTF